MIISSKSVIYLHNITKRLIETRILTNQKDLVTPDLKFVIQITHTTRMPVQILSLKIDLPFRTLISFQ